MIAWWLAMGVALGQPLVPKFEESATHTWKVEIHEMEPSYLGGSDFTRRYAEVWGAVLACRVVAPRKESCAIVGGTVWWGYQEAKDGLVRWFDLPLHGTLEIAYARDGHIVNKRIEGFDQAFYDAAAEAYASLFGQHGGSYRSANDRRNVGERIGQDLLMRLVAPLDLALPKKGDASAPWTSTHFSAFARRYTGSVGGGKLIMSPMNAEPRGLPVRISGEVGETPPNSVVQGTSVSTQVSGYAVLGPDGRPVEVDIWTGARSSTAFSGFAVHHFRATAFHEGMRREPADPPPIPRG